jgi:hypothetical protein
MQLIFKRVLPVFAGVLMFSMMLAGSAWASGAPFAETKLDTGVGETKATLNGVVNPNGLATKYYFEYGTTKTYGSKTAEASAGSGTSNLEESKALTGLIANTTYYYRIVATNSSGTTDGAQEVFYTTAIPQPEFKPVPTKKKFTSTSGTLTWQMGTEKIVCTKSTIAGEVTSASTLGKMVMKLTGCAFRVGGEECPIKSTNTTTEGEVVTNALKGELGTVETQEAASGVGLLLEPETGKVISTIAKPSRNCTEMPETALEGALAGEVATVGKKQTTNKLAFGTATVQKIKAITVKSGEKHPKFTGYGAVIDTEVTDALAFEEALEVT